MKQTLKYKTLRRYAWFKNTKVGAFLVGFAKLYDRYAIGSMSAESTYFLILSIIPFVVFSFNMILFFAHSQLPKVLQLMQLLPKQTQDFMLPVIMQLLESRSETILSIGILVAFWSTAKGVEGLIRALNRILNVNKEEDNIVMVYVKAILFTILWTTMAMSSLLLMVYGDAIFDLVASYYNFSREIIRVWNQIVYLSPVIVITLGLAVFYRYAPKFTRGTRISWKKALFSGVIGSFLWMFITFLYRYYIGHLANMSITYGPLVGLMALFIWMNLSCRAVMFGALTTRTLEDIGVFASRRELSHRRRR